MSSAPDALLDIEGLDVAFVDDRGHRNEVVSGVSLKLARGRTLGIVGESGSGKSVTALSIMRLLQRSAAHVAGRIRLEGVDLLSLPEHRMQDLRGNRLAMIFQEPMTSLNPSFTVGDQIAEALIRHRRIGRRQARAEAIGLLRRVRIPSPEARVDEYPHKLSGGMRQRVMIAMALACAPALLIADEPTTALDVTIQAQVLDLMRSLRDDTGMAIMLITHDLGVVAELCDDVAVMYAGQIVEQAPVATLFEAPQHPYTVGLIGSIPRLAQERAQLAAIRGAVPTRVAELRGCRFADRCPFVDDACRSAPPPFAQIRPLHWTRCRKAPLESIPAATPAVAANL